MIYRIYTNVLFNLQEYGKSGKFFSVLPFKDLLDKIYDEHDVEQD